MTKNFIRDTEISNDFNSCDIRLRFAWEAITSHPFEIVFFVPMLHYIYTGCPRKLLKLIGSHFDMYASIKMAQIAFEIRHLL